MSFAKKNIAVLGLLIILAIQGSLIIFYGNQKVGFYADEFFTYLQSNSYDEPEWYVPENEWVDHTFLHEYMTVQEGERFAYISVWNNLRADVHPPIYSWLFHTISSFFPDILNKWMGILLNLAISIPTVCMIYLIACRLFENRAVALAPCIMYSCSNIALSSAMFTRMYQLLILMVLISVWWHVRYIKENCDRKAYAKLILLTVLGTLTHYYFLIFAFFEAAVYCIYKWRKNDKKSVQNYAVSMLISAAVCTAAFPPMIRDIFFGYRGAESFSKLVTTDGFMHTIISIARMYAARLFGNFSIPVLFMISVLALACIIWYRKKEGKVPADVRHLVLVVPVGGFFLMVAKTAPYVVDRYYLGASAAAVLVLVWLMYASLQWVAARKIVTVLLLLICTVAPIRTLRAASLTYWHQYAQSDLDHLKALDADQCIYVIDDDVWKLSDNIDVMMQFDQLYFVKEKDLESMFDKDMALEDRIVVCISSDHPEQVLDAFKNKYGYSNTELLYQISWSGMYCLNK